jgi:putative solute:sodium symporter small subunit
VGRQKLIGLNQKSISNSNNPTAKKMEDNKEKMKAYWRKNLSYLSVLLTIWFIVSYGCGILFVNQLNTIKLGGFKLGFWFAQQGSIYVFVILIFIYVFLMNRLDKEFDVDEK